MNKKNTIGSTIVSIIMSFLSVAWLFPIFLIILNSFKKRSAVTKSPFSMLNSDNFVRLENYVRGIEKANFFKAAGNSLFITVFSVTFIVLLTAMTAWMITRYKSKLSTGIYYGFVFSMIVPFQMVMFTMSSVADFLKLQNRLGIVLIYIGFGAGLSVFIFSGFIRGIPIDMEEAAIVDGASPMKTFFFIVFPILRPTAVTVAILNVMWIWNDYLLPKLVIGKNYPTIPIVVEALQGSYGSKDMGALMALLVLAIIPIVVFYLICQKHIIEGVVSGAVKG